MMQAFLYGIGYGGGFCLVLAVFVLAVATAVRVRDRVMARMARRRCQQMISEAVGGLGDEDIEALLRGDGTAGG